MTGRRVALIAAVDRNMVLGLQGRLPWYLPADLYRFRTLTKHHPLIMGRRTFLSIGRPLPERLSIVLTHNPQRMREHRGTPGLVVATSIEAALAIADRHPAPSGRTFVIGGAVVFHHTIGLADEVLLTVIDTEVEGGDAYFPVLAPPRFVLVEEEAHDPDQRNWTGYRFLTYHRLG